MSTFDNPQLKADRPSAEVKYVGIRTGNGSEVWVSRDNSVKRLNPRFDLRHHSPTGFEWGYGGSGPAQLALALLADWSGDDGFALQHYQNFKFKLIAGLPRREWELTGAQIREVVAAMVAPKRA
ncbi:MAG TPA: DUF6166 domain-containing protein [Terriglobales bacterium]|nr:DUF6166 domain-containing protein [Terriglobales bacterium]